MPSSHRVHAKTLKESLPKTLAVQQHLDRLRIVYDDAWTIFADIGVCGVGLYIGGVRH